MLFLYRIFPIVSFRRIVIGCGALILAFQTASVIVAIFACTPVSAFWLTFMGRLPSPLRHRCINLPKFLIAQGSINTVTDIVLLLLVRYAPFMNQNLILN